MDEGNTPPSETEYMIDKGVEPYIDRKDLEKLLLTIFKKTITVYHHNGIFRYTASRKLTDKEVESITRDERVR